MLYNKVPVKNAPKRVIHKEIFASNTYEIKGSTLAQYSEDLPLSFKLLDEEDELT